VEESAEFVPMQDPEMRQEVLKNIIRDLHEGVDIAVLKQGFYEVIKDLDAAEIARMEQKLMEEGMPEIERIRPFVVRRLLQTPGLLKSVIDGERGDGLA